MKRIGLVFVGTLCAGAAFGDLAEYVDPFTGTAGTGHTHPAACVPFGMVQAGFCGDSPLKNARLLWFCVKLPDCSYTDF